jgi:peptidoglycan/LPS O-acetylase OafA/YrhL
MTTWQKKYGAMLLMFVSTLFASTAQVMWKYGLMQEQFINIIFISGFFVYLIGGLLMIIAFRRGELSILLSNPCDKLCVGKFSFSLFLW